MRVITENLKYSYGKNGVLSVNALNGISLTIESGEFFGIVGRTGSGKTTFVQHINGLIKTQKNCGRITVGEYDLTNKSTDFKKLRAKVGMIFQYPEYQLFAETVYDDVAFAIKNFYPDLKEFELFNRVKDAITLSGLDFYKVKDKSPFELSGGQKRRVAIAGVLSYRPEILVLDEPVAGLDPRGKKEFLALLKRLKDDFVKTIIIVSHDMDLVSENCSRIAVFGGGKILAVGTPNEVFSNKKLIEENGLSLPVVAYLKDELKKKGVELNCGITVKEFVSAYAKIKGVGKCKK